MNVCDLPTELSGSMMLHLVRTVDDGVNVCDLPTELRSGSMMLNLVKTVDDGRPEVQPRPLTL